MKAEILSKRQAELVEQQRMHEQWSVDDPSPVIIAEKSMTPKVNYYVIIFTYFSVAYVNNVILLLAWNIRVTLKKQKARFN